MLSLGVLLREKGDVPFMKFVENTKLSIIHVFEVLYFYAKNGYIMNHSYHMFAAFRPCHPLPQRDGNSNELFSAGAQPGAVRQADLVRFHWKMGMP